MKNVIRKAVIPVVVFLLASSAMVFTGCGYPHPIVITPLHTPVRDSTPVNPKKVAYVITEAERNRTIITEGGSGETLTYNPYRDIEKAIRDTLRSVYSDVYVLNSPNDLAAISQTQAAFVFKPDVSTYSKSPSAFTWPPTEFRITLTCLVTDPKGGKVTHLTVVGEGTAVLDDFIKDFGLAGRRAVTDMAFKLKKEILANPLLR
jgi:hypothetical protein